MPLPPCPHCGDTENGVFVNGQMRGPIEHWYDSNGEFQEMSTDRMWSTTNDVVRCGKCFRIRRDVHREDNQIYPNIGGAS